MDEDELANLYRAEATQSQEEEAAKRIAESADPVLDERLRATPVSYTHLTLPTILLV